MVSSIGLQTSRHQRSSFLPDGNPYDWGGLGGILPWGIRAKPSSSPPLWRISSLGVDVSSRLPSGKLALRFAIPFFERSYFEKKLTTAEVAMTGLMDREVLYTPSLWSPSRVSTPCRTPLELAEASTWTPRPTVRQSLIRRHMLAGGLRVNWNV